MPGGVLERLSRDLERLKAQSLFKAERPLGSPQSAHVRLAAADAPALNLCSNNYLGLANHPAILDAAHDALDRYGFGMASVRFICGTQTIHRELEERLSAFLHTEDTILFGSCFDANAGLFEALLGEEDAIVSDALNHASIIDGVRLSKARRFRYANGDMAALEQALDSAAGARTTVVVTDGVFSMDGIVADLAAICARAERHNALVMVDDSHAVGVVGPGGRGTPALHGVEDRVDILTGTFGKALGGAAGGYVSGRAEIVAWLRQRARPYLFSNSLMPAICAAALAALDLVERSPTLRQALAERTAQMRDGLGRDGFHIEGRDHPIIPVITGEARLAVGLAERLAARGILVTPFSYPVVPEGAARIRVQVSAAHSSADIDQALVALAAAGREVGLI